MTLIEHSLEFRESIRCLFLVWFCPHVLASEKARIDQNLEIKEHWKRYSIEVFELIRETWDPPESKQPTQYQFVVFIDLDLDVDWITEGDLVKEAEKPVSYAESIGARRCKHLPKEQILEFKRLIGQAIVNAINGEFNYSHELSNQAADFLKGRTIERSRSWTLTSAHCFFIFFSVCLLFFLKTRAETANLQSDDLCLFWLTAQGGIIGAYLSIVQKAGRGEWDAAAGQALHYLEVFTKILAGGVLGAVGFALSRSVFAPVSLKGLSLEPYSALALGVAAGFFERTIPKMISSYSKFDNSGK